ncbi:MAG: ATP-binding protein [Candidatus Latescibacterota bacterium]
MRRQFLRVYVGIALVLLAAALITLLVVEWQVRQVVDRRIEEAMSSAVLRIRSRLLQAGEDAAQRARILERLNDSAPFAVSIVPRAEVELSAQTVESLEADRPALVRRDGQRLLYAALSPEELLMVGPLVGPLRGALGPRHGPGPGGPEGAGPEPEFRLHLPGQRRGPRLLMGPEPPPLPWLPFQGMYLLVGALLVILLTIGVAVYLLLRPFERRIYALADVARDFGDGQLQVRARPQGDDAIAALASAFNRMAESITRFIERQRELLSAVSHELRTPLARLFFLVDDAQGATGEAEKNRLLQRIEVSLQDLNDLVDELLTFVRLDRHGEPPPAQAVAVGPVLQEVAAVLSDLRSEVSMEVDCPEVQVAVVPRLLRRAVLNLATNASRHAQSRLRITCSLAGGQVCISVDDDGPGIPPEAREKVFEPFFRLDESRSAEAGGAGLGLAIVRRIADLHGGSVTATDSPLGGARFVLALPAAPA